MPMFFLNHLPWFWVAVVALCVVVEAFTMALTTIWFACGALVMVFVAFTPLAFKWQVVIFVFISFALLLFTRPLAAKKLAKRTPTNADGLIGKKALVTQAITELDKGEVKVNGVLWTARSAGDKPVASGAECRIVGIEGNTLVVEAL